MLCLEDVCTTLLCPESSAKTDTGKDCKIFGWDYESENILPLFNYIIQNQNNLR